MQYVLVRFAKCAFGMLQLKHSPIMVPSIMISDQVYYPGGSSVDLHFSLQSQEAHFALFSCIMGSDIWYSILRKLMSLLEISLNMKMTMVARKVLVQLLNRKTIKKKTTQPVLEQIQRW